MPSENLWNGTDANEDCIGQAIKRSTRHSSMFPANSCPSKSGNCPIASSDLLDLESLSSNSAGAREKIIWKPHAMALHSK
jgi:hypothetical protein